MHTNVHFLRMYKYVSVCINLLIGFTRNVRSKVMAWQNVTNDAGKKCGLLASIITSLLHLLWFIERK